MLITHGGKGLDDIQRTLRVMHIGFRPAAALAGVGRRLVPAPGRAGQQAFAHRAPHQGADGLVQRHRQQFVLGFARFGGVVNLLSDGFEHAVQLGCTQGFHHLPGGEVAGAEVANFPGAH